MLRIPTQAAQIRSGDKVVFLHTVTPGTADHSYGIQVAKMAGLPEELTERAKKILNNREDTQLRPHGVDQDNGHLKDDRYLSSGGRRKLSVKAEEKIQLTMFEMKDDELREALKKIDINAITPLEALKILAKLKEQLG